MWTSAVEDVQVGAVAEALQTKLVVLLQPVRVVLLLSLRLVRNALDNFSRSNTHI